MEEREMKWANRRRNRQRRRLLGQAALVLVGLC